MVAANTFHINMAAMMVVVVVMVAMVMVVVMVVVVVMFLVVHWSQDVARPITVATNHLWRQGTDTDGWMVVQNSHVSRSTQPTKKRVWCHKSEWNGSRIANKIMVECVLEQGNTLGMQSFGLQHNLLLTSHGLRLRHFLASPSKIKACVP